MNPIKYTITNESITFIWQGSSRTVKEGSPNFKELRSALFDKRWDDVAKHLTVGRSLESWAKGKFSVGGDVIKYNGKELPENLTSRITTMARNGENPEPMFMFWEKLQKNPSYRSVNQLWNFMQHQNIALDTEGNILAYKAVDPNYQDYHSGKFTNKPGTTNQMPRNEISDDPDFACHAGFHVGSIEYAQTFGGPDRRMVICKVHPEDVVCIPHDESSQKMRVAKYVVIGNYGSNLPSTTFTEDSYDDDLGKRDNEELQEDLSDKEQGGTVEASINERTERMQGRKSKKGFAKFDKMEMDGLMNQSIEDLRKYATHGLEITGASKIPGGKTMLVLRILEVRR